MFDKLSKQSQPFEDQTKNHINKYAEAGLRTLVIAYRPLDEAEYKTWHEEFLAAKTSVSVDRDSLVDAAAEKIERDLILLGSKNKSNSVPFALIIDGRSLTFALEKNLEGLFLDVATDCSSVICCRSSP